MGRKTIFCTSLATMLIIIASCVQKPSAVSSAYLNYSTEIRSTDPIVFSINDSLSFNGLEKKIANSVKIEPKVDFTVSVLNSQTVGIKPVAPLVYGTKYKITVNMSKIFGSAKGDVRSFDVSILFPVLSYNIEKLTLYPDKEGIYYIKGTIESSEMIDSSYIEHGLSLSVRGCPVKWSHEEGGRSHSFVVEDIASSSEPYEMDVKLDYSKYDRNGIVKNSYVIPAKGKFLVIDKDLILEPYHYKITFSSELDKKQVFDELVTMPDAGKMKFSVNVNQLLIYPANITENTQRITILKEIKNTKMETMYEDWSFLFQIPSAKPSVKFISKGSILPSSNGMKVHFQSINYAKVEVRVRRIYESNILQYLQSEDLNSPNSYNLDRVSRVVADTTISLGDSGSVKLRNLSNYGIDISQIIKPQKGAIYKVEIRGREELTESKSEDDWESDYYFGSYSDYKYRNLNILASDIGVIAKGSDNGNYTFFVTNLITAKPISGAKIKVYDRVNQLIGEGQTNGEGRFSAAFEEPPFTAVISSGYDKSYIKMEGGLSISLSNYDVDGASYNKGQKGYIFGERGVWRPGDEIYLTFISMLAEGALPQGHPVSASLSNPQGQVIQTLVNNNGSHGMYGFTFKTDPNAPTGNWMVAVTAGGQTYTKTIKIETIKPNKLLIDLSFDGEPLISGASINGSMKVKWLVGTPGKNLETRVDMDLYKGVTSFDKYKNFVFEDASRVCSEQTREIAQGETDENGRYSFTSSLSASKSIPGFMKAVFTTRVFEPSGDFSTDSYTCTVSPFDTYIGLHIPEEERTWGGKYLNIENEHICSIVAVDKSGNAKNIDKVEVELYQMGWSWWWGASSSTSLASYSKDSYNKPFGKINITLKNGKGQFNLNMSKYESGFYFFRVTDPVGGHATSKVVLCSYSYENELGGNPSGAAKLLISADKEVYNAGETAMLTIPSSAGARALVCIEKGEEILSSQWIECKGTKTVIPIPLKGKMAPNVYASITLIQPHNTVTNDAPIRMFGVQRIKVEDALSHLVPVITAQEEVRPESEILISVKERDGRPMSYVLALVDEGLLSLTRYKTPNPWGHFYATEALGIKTWDLYNMVIGAYGAKMEGLFAIGGDGESDVTPSSPKAERFKPVSIFLGPFALDSKGVGSHKILIPPYIGSLRVMVIATDGRAQGATDKNVSVKKPLMVQTTMPRVIGTDEEMEVPVTLFAMKDGLGKVTVKIETNENLSVIGEERKSVQLDGQGEEMVSFRLKASSDDGIGIVKVYAKCGSDSAGETLEIYLRNPNPPTTLSQTLLLKAGESKDVEMQLVGKNGSALVEASVLPPIDLDYRLTYLIEYPHGCIEQSVSSVFPQLYLNDLLTLDEDKVKSCENNIKSAISKLPLFSKSSGGFTYWPGTDGSISFWGTAYATHFMIEAQRKGYSISQDLLDKSLRYLRGKISGNDESTLDKAYAFFVLALAGEAPRGAMNRMREDIASIPASAKWFLAAAYSLDNKKSVAESIVTSLSTADTGIINPFSGTFDSYERVLSTAIITYTRLGEQKKAFSALETLSKLLNDRKHFMSTQSTAWALNAIAGYAKGEGAGGVDLSVKSDGKKYSVKNTKSIGQVSLDSGSGKRSVGLTNNSTSQTHVVLSSKGVPEAGEERNFANGLKIYVTYTALGGGSINPYKLEQGTDFSINVTVNNTNPLVDYTNLVLTQIFPSGWEFKRSGSDDFYQNFRDDRVYSHFDLKRSDSIVIKIKATATYKGHFYLPATTCEAMYDASVSASVRGGWCEVL